MYIAQRWLLGMVFAMWISLCLIDICLKDNTQLLHLTEINEVHNFRAILLQNSSIQQNQFEGIENKIRSNRQNKSVILQYMMFISGACVVVVYYRKKDIMLYMMITVKAIKKHGIKNEDVWRKIQTLKITAISIGVAILKFLELCKEIFEKLLNNFLKKYKQQLKRRDHTQNVNVLLLNKLREYDQERHNLGHILFATMQENKNIRMQYQIEALAKKRLVRQIEDTQKRMKDNRSRFVGFQQLYIIAQQENNFLKSRIRKLIKEKEEAEKNLIKLVNYVWQSKNNDLKAFCSRLIVKTKNNLLNSDAKLEIEQFLKQPSNSKKESDNSHTLGTIKEVNESFHSEEDSRALVKDAPKLRGLPGECVWTVKDKDGLIQKLYEYDTDFDNGDTIRRIRQYSVYHDNDCLLDVSSSTTLIQNTNIDLSGLCNQYTNKCITGSQAFKTFLKNNKVIVNSRRSTVLPPQLTY